MTLFQVATLQLTAAAIGAAVQLCTGRRAQVATSAGNGRRVAGAVGSLIVALIVWNAICMLFKILTWKPFAGDVPGSVEATAMLLFTGSAAAGFFVSKWLFRQASR
jgi:hypothetical protein